MFLFIIRVFNISILYKTFILFLFIIIFFNASFHYKILFIIVSILYRRQKVVEAVAVVSILTSFSGMNMLLMLRKLLSEIHETLTMKTI